MNRGPRGLAGYMADGGPVYMKNGGGSSEANARKDVLSTIYEIESNSNYDQAFPSQLFFKNAVLKSLTKIST